MSRCGLILYTVQSQHGGILFLCGSKDMKKFQKGINLGQTQFNSSTVEIPWFHNPLHFWFSWCSRRSEACELNLQMMLHKMPTDNHFPSSCACFFPFTCWNFFKNYYFLKMKCPYICLLINITSEPLDCFCTFPILPVKDWCPVSHSLTTPPPVTNNSVKHSTDSIKNPFHTQPKLVQIKFIIDQNWINSV